MKKEIIISATIICVVIGGSVLTSQKMKQNSIERQLEMKISQENLILENERERVLIEEANARGEEITKKRELEKCIDLADYDYWSYVELNGKGKRYDEGGVTAQTNIWNTAEKNKEKDIDNCYKKFNI